ncbi:amidohydrolase family protein [Paenibacillus xerothermodurans]|uniref:Amidohydrolase n=1 Tax=Paenibacillus xerothermodurans TaxID=1977292 RepID=A0A2W1NS00_PAEXE|nr:amidohydrolase family protein [Paenibacillus xerothermodurans]PZE22335.1 amidohydrolase [Paenibacillus xerothermodurans]
MRIDAHQHYWKLDRGDYGWLSPHMGVLYRDYLPDDLKPLLQKADVTATIVVQAAPTVEETEFLLALCEQEPSLAGVVGWLDLEAPDFEAQLDRLMRSPYFLGIRPMLQDLDDDAYICKDAVIRSLSILAEKGAALDLLVKTQHLPSAIEMLGRIPKLRAVIDHIAKPNIAEQAFEPWRELMQEASAFPNVHCKLSGMMTEANHTHWKQEDIKPYVSEICRMFGPDRVMFGSDWPVCLLAASYEQVVSLLLQTLPHHWPDSAKEKVFGANAAAFYGIGTTFES